MSEKCSKHELNFKLFNGYTFLFIKFTLHLSVGSQCRGHPTVGLCEKLIIGYTFDSVSQKCLRFKVGGCGLSKNGFKSEEECTNQCHRIPYGGKVTIHS